MIDLVYATSIVENHLRKPENCVVGDTWIVCENKTIHGEFGWMFFYTTKRFQETGNWRYEAPGNVPLLVDKDGLLCLAASGAQSEATIFAFVKNRADFRVRCFSSFNHFIAPICCPDCGLENECAFIAKIGVLAGKNVRIGQRAFPVSPVDLGSVAHAANLGDSDFISHGLGICSSCRAALWADILIRKGNFFSLKVGQQPPNPEARTLC